MTWQWQGPSFADFAGGALAGAVWLGVVAQAGCGDGTRVSLGEGPLVESASFGSATLVPGSQASPEMTRSRL